jgi:hypothetical protein
VPGARLLGPPIESKRALPNTLCVLVPGSDGKVLRHAPRSRGARGQRGLGVRERIDRAVARLARAGTHARRGARGLRLSLGRNTTARIASARSRVFHGAVRLVARNLKRRRTVAHNARKFADNSVDRTCKRAV